MLNYTILNFIYYILLLNFINILLPAEIGGWWETYSVIILSFPSLKSQVSPNKGLNGLVVLSIADSKAAKLYAIT